MTVGIASNITSLVAQRRLAQGSDAVERTTERMASGLRVNRASDDAAGLSVASSLQLQTRVYTQGIKNINDGLSLLAVAQGALMELSTLAVRQQELSIQASNGVYSNAQREALDRETQALSVEFNRIIETTSYNGLKVLSSPRGEVRIQTGFGSDGSLGITLGSHLAHPTGTSLIDGTTTLSTSAARATALDVNGDGRQDVIGAVGNQISISLGNGDGTFKAAEMYQQSGSVHGLSTGDINGDGIADIAATSSLGAVYTILGNGNGTFKAGTSYAAGPMNRSLVIADLSGDGKMDIASGDLLSSTITILIGNGDGTLKAGTTLPTLPLPSGLLSGDMNGDGILDLILSAEGTGGGVSIYSGNGDGTFKAATNVLVSGNPKGVALADLNRDGNTDIVTAGDSSNTINVRIGNGDGTFGAERAYASGVRPFGVAAADFNADGIPDLVSADYTSGTASIFIGNGDGTFKARSYFATSPNSWSIALADFNGDYAPDIVTAGNSIKVLTGGIRATNHMPEFTITTATDARSSIEVIALTRERIGAELGAIGAFQSRLSTALSTLQSSRENTTAAASRILDADIATEAATMTGATIRQRVTSSLLAQINQLPALAVSLLN